MTDRTAPAKELVTDETAEVIKALRAMVTDPNLSVEYSPALIAALRLLRRSQMAQSNDHARSGSPSLSPSEPSGRGESGGHTPDDRSLSMNKEEKK